MPLNSIKTKKMRMMKTRKKSTTTTTRIMMTRSIMKSSHGWRKRYVKLAKLVSSLRVLMTRRRKRKKKRKSRKKIEEFVVLRTM